MRSEAIPYYGIEGFINDDDDEGSGRPIFDPPSFQLSDNCRQPLNIEIPSTWTPSNFGMVLYLKALHTVKRSVAC